MNRSATKPTLNFNPYRVSPGPQLDAHIHSEILKKSFEQQYPEYSTDNKAADVVRQHLQRHCGISVTVGRTSTAARSWFARYEIDKGNPTEALGETYAIAICRLAILRSQRI
jgi:hypothetical protein